jgi:hypothetical protein
MPCIGGTTTAENINKRKGKKLVRGRTTAEDKCLKKGEEKR